MPKMKVCCGRLQAKLVMEEANLARNARRRESAADRGSDTTGWEAKIAEDKARIAHAKETIIDHEAEHAGER